MIEAYAAAVEAGHQKQIFKVKASADDQEIYNKNVGRLGLLRGRLPESIPAFYTVTNSMLADFECFYDAVWDKEPNEFSFGSTGTGAASRGRSRMRRRDKCAS